MRKKSNWPFPSCIRQMGKNEHDEWTIATLYELLLVEEPGFKNVKNKHLGMPPF